MNEIEKLYENVGIKPTKNWRSCMYCKEKTKIHYDDWGEEYLTCDRMEMNVEKCPNAKEYYPIFTTEKQLELIKWLCQHTYRNYIKFRFDICGLWYCECNMSSSDMHHTFEDVLTDVLIQLWQDLTEEEKNEIRRILE